MLGRDLAVDRPVACGRPVALRELLLQARIPQKIKQAAGRVAIPTRNVDLNWSASAWLLTNFRYRRPWAGWPTKHFGPCSFELAQRSGEGSAPDDMDSQHQKISGGGVPPGWREDMGGRNPSQIAERPHDQAIKDAVATAHRQKRKNQAGQGSKAKMGKQRAGSRDLLVTGGGDALDDLARWQRITIPVVEQRVKVPHGDGHRQRGRKSRQSS